MTACGAACGAADGRGAEWGYRGVSGGPVADPAGRGCRGPTRRQTVLTLAAFISWLAIGAWAACVHELESGACRACRGQRTSERCMHGRCTGADSSGRARGRRTPCAGRKRRSRLARRMRASQTVTRCAVRVRQSVVRVCLVVCTRPPAYEDPLDGPGPSRADARSSEQPTLHAKVRRNGSSFESLGHCPLPLWPSPASPQPAVAVSPPAITRAAAPCVHVHGRRSEHRARWRRCRACLAFLRAEASIRSLGRWPLATRPRAARSPGRSTAGRLGARSKAGPET